MAPQGRRRQPRSKNQSLFAETKDQPQKSWNVDLETMGNTHWSKGRHFVKRKVEVGWWVVEELKSITKIEL